MKDSLYIEEDILRDSETREVDQEVIFKYLDSKYPMGWTKFINITNCLDFNKKYIATDQKIFHKVKTAINEFNQYISQSTDKLRHLNWPYKLEFNENDELYTDFDFTFDFL